MKEEIWTQDEFRYALSSIISKFASPSGETAIIVQAHNLNVRELLNLLECSLNAQKDELSRLKSSAKQQAKRLDALSQGVLL